MSLSLSLDWTLDVDARELTGRMLETIEASCKAALRRGVRPDTGAPRPERKGRPWGVSSGRLLGNIRRTPVTGGPEVALGTVSVPPDRQEFADRNDVLTVEGKVGEEIEDAIDGYLGERLG